MSYPDHCWLCGCTDSVLWNWEGVWFCPDCFLAAKPISRKDVQELIKKFEYEGELSEDTIAEEMKKIIKKVSDRKKEGK